MIESVIFDLGGVILNIDYQKTIDQFKSLGISDFNKNYSQFNQSNLFDLFETGQISEADFFSKLQDGDPKICKTSLMDAWNAMLLDLPKERWDFLLALKEQLPIVLLSNTNETHVTALNKLLPEETSLNKLKSIFKNAYFSNEIGLRKPEKETFEWVLKQNNFKAETTLFIDDSIQHIEGAKSIGIKTWHLDKGSILDLDTALQAHH